MNLDEEQERLNELLAKKTIKNIVRHKDSEIVIQFLDGSCFIVDACKGQLEFSITGAKSVD